MLKSKIQRKCDFVKIKQNRKILQTIHYQILPNGRSKWKTKPIEKLLLRARKEIGYSSNTSDLRIINALYKQSRTGEL